MGKRRGREPAYTLGSSPDFSVRGRLARSRAESTRRTDVRRLGNDTRACVCDFRRASPVWQAHTELAQVPAQFASLQVCMSDRACAHVRGFPLTQAFPRAMAANSKGGCRRTGCSRRAPTAEAEAAQRVALIQFVRQQREWGEGTANGELGGVEGAQEEGGGS